ncbi:hypothetical protein ON010_g7363 [Phytophthora cinnamomi]|nr:hypothetical protein ON010_g7363 [Phytophthora cinnamomi]
MDITFYFNAEGKCCKMVVDTDFVGAFASILQHPESVDLLFGRALIADNSMLGVIEELPPHAVETYDRGLSGVGAAPHYGEAGTKSSVNRKLTSVPCYDQAENMASPRANACSSLEPLPPRPSTNPDILKLCLQTVEDYYLAFSRGYQTEKSAGANELILAFQHDFLLHRFASATAHGNYTSAEYVAERWRSLSTWFSVLGFNKKSVASIEHHEHVGTCALSSSARYTLCITPTTVQSVFPHIEAHSPLYGELVGEIVTVPSQIYFSVDIETGQICRLEERMDFVVGLSAIVTSKQELDFVMSKANLTLDGVNF